MNIKTIKLIIGINFSLFAGHKLGILLSQNLDQSTLLPFNSIAQVQKKVDQTKKPALLFLLRPMNVSDCMFRMNFLRAANKHKDKADFYLMSLKKDFQQATLLPFTGQRNRGWVYGIIPRKQKFSTIFQMQQNQNFYGIQNFLRILGALEDQHPLMKFQISKIIQ